MPGNMNIINVEAFLNAFEAVNCGKAHVVQLDSKDFEIKQEETKPLKGFEFPENFPGCCESHKQIVAIGIEKLSKFPNCCEGHKRLNEAWWFKKEDYSYLPIKLVSTITYTWHCISSALEKPTWYKDITDYIDYTKKSYGQFPDGYGSPLGLDLYLFNLEKNLENEKDIPDNKKVKLIEFIKDYSKPVEEVEQVDLNLLISKYKDWLKVFPFELSFLTHLKPFFEKQMPIFSGKGETNQYTGLTGYKIKTKKELTTFLVSTTLTIVKELNTRKLYQENLLSNAKEMQIEIISAKRKIEIEQIDKTDWKDRKGYIKMLKKWLKGEKEYIKEIGLLFKDVVTVRPFIPSLVDGMQALQKNDTNEACIKNVREDRPDKETSFRYWFKNFFLARYPDASVTAEEEKGDGRIDLKISSPAFGDKIIEFKGWWNHDKVNSAGQICSYLTDFENDGYIFMINHLVKKDITNDYKNLILAEQTNFIQGSWVEHKFENTDLIYFESRHQFATKEKTIFHFIFNVFF